MEYILATIIVESFEGLLFLNWDEKDDDFLDEFFLASVKCSWGMFFRPTNRIPCRIQVIRKEGNIENVGEYDPELDKWVFLDSFDQNEKAFSFRSTKHFNLVEGDQIKILRIFG